ncbi:hypothetical protein [Ichthyobacterium seriolicida]|uniref:Uncharacterized protein n=1 Tax=Ichthyobacterium seriolicida TaxID=242600 RepID=A0A1J1DZU2_9FLAO|nr:hypothetical protein [Ichthyobacterium seriolicida]BAV94197.1 hypothetical protein JBKA6_0184 [Ichthyobacterium seriolicida]
MKKVFKKLSIVLMIGIIVFSCEKEPSKKEISYNTAVKKYGYGIKSFTFEGKKNIDNNLDENEELSPVAAGHKGIYFNRVPHETILEGLTPTIKLHDGFSITPSTDEPQDFDTPDGVKYTLTSTDGDKVKKTEISVKLNKIKAPKLVEIESFKFSKENNKITGSIDSVTALYKGMFINKTPQRKFEDYTDEEIILNSKITIDKNDIYVKFPYNGSLGLDNATGNLNAVITFKKVPDGVDLIQKPPLSSVRIKSLDLDLPITMGKHEFTHSNMLSGISKHVRFSKDYGSEVITEDYFVHFEYDKSIIPSSNCDLFPVNLELGKSVDNLAFTKNYVHDNEKVNNTYMCLLLASGHGQWPCTGEIKNDVSITPVLTKSITGNMGSTEENPIEIHFRKDYWRKIDNKNVNITKNTFDVALVSGYKLAAGKEMPNFKFIADNIVLPDGAFFSTEGLKGTKCYAQIICPKDPSKLFEVSNKMPYRNNGIIFKVVAQDGITYKIYRLLFENKYQNSSSKLTTD